MFLIIAGLMEEEILFFYHDNFLHRDNFFTSGDRS